MSAFAAALARIRKRHDFARIAKLVREVESLDEAKAIAAIEQELRASYRRYRSVDQPITTIHFYWAGAEVAPWIPTEVMGNVYAGKRRLLESTGGFTPHPLPALQWALEQDAELGDHDAFDDLRALFVSRSFELATTAIVASAGSKELAALDTARPFTFTGTPGHDETRVTLHRLDS